MIVFYGADRGVTTKGVRVFDEDTPGIAGTPEAFDAFGRRSRRETSTARAPMTCARRAVR